METVIVLIPIFVLSRQGEIYILCVRLQFHIRSHDGIPVRLVLEYFAFILSFSLLVVAYYIYNLFSASFTLQEGKEAPQKSRAQSVPSWSFHSLW